MIWPERSIYLIVYAKSWQQSGEQIFKSASYCITVICDAEEGER